MHHCVWFSLLSFMYETALNKNKYSGETDEGTSLFCPQPSLSVLYMLSDGATHEAVHLLCRMLVFDPVSSDDAHEHSLGFR